MYLDDILIFSKTPEEHEKNLRLVLQVLRENKFYAKMSKCHFFKEELEYLGHVVGKDGIRVDPKKVEAVTRWPVPQDVGQLCSFLGFNNYFRRFLQGYSSMVGCLTLMTRKRNCLALDRRMPKSF